MYEPSTYLKCKDAPPLSLSLSLSLPLSLREYSISGALCACRALRVAYMHNRISNYLYVHRCTGNASAECTCAHGVHGRDARAVNPLAPSAARFWYARSFLRVLV